MTDPNELTQGQRDRLEVWGANHKNKRTRECYARDVGAFLVYCENLSGVVVAKDNAAHVAKLANKWLRGIQGQAAASVARKASAVRSYLVYCGLGDAAYEVQRPKIKNARTALFDPNEVDKLLAHKKVTPRMRAILVALSLCPLTLDRVLNLRHKDLEMSAGVIRGPFFDEVREAIESYLAIRLAGVSKLSSAKDAFVFRSYSGKPLSRQAAWKEVRNAGYLLSPPRALNCNHLKTSYIIRVYSVTDDIAKTSDICGLPEEAIRRLVTTLKARKGKTNAA